MAPTAPLALEMRDISIAFPGVQALDRVGFRTTTGVAHALVGANGAGKSTLMKVLAGAYSHYTGTISLDGVPVSIRSPRDAKALGIEVVYQEVDTSLVPYLSVAENVMLDELVNGMGRRQLVGWRGVRRRAAEALAQLGVSLDPDEPVSALPLAHKQMVLIARALSQSCRFLVLDEPTAPLSGTETEDLFRALDDLMGRGMGVIFISHRLPEVKRLCDEITVLRDGRHVASAAAAALSPADIVEHMLGRRLEEATRAPAVAHREPLFEVKGLTDHAKVFDVDLRVGAGEIVGLAGLVGAGKTELCKALFGATRATCREARLAGRPYRIADPAHAVRRGMALVPEERRREGVLVEESVAANLTAVSLSSYCVGPFVRRAEERRAAEGMIRSLGIRTPNARQRVANLSGGNQQKVAVGKWLLADASLYVFDEPTKGIDVGAKRDVYDLLRRLAATGKGVVYASCELGELLAITHRIYVLYDGRVVRELETARTSEEEILFYATGGR
jgi:simple sugar transport system ATP-binding protein